jgi:hypothetical protein
VRPHKPLAALVLCLLAAARSPAADDSTREYVDEITAASITTSTDTLVFARERTDLAVNARDYITLLPVEINRTGTRSCFWSGYLWSTIDRRNRKPWLAEGDELVLLADGRPIRLRITGKTLKDQGAAQPISPSPSRTAIPVLFTTTPEEIAYVAHASEVRVELLHAGTSEPFVLWKGKPELLRAFSEHVAP